MGGLGLGEAPTGALEVSKPRIATPGRGQSGQLGGSDLGVVGWGMGPGSQAAQPGAPGCAKSVRIVGSGVSKARIRKPGSGGRGGRGSYLDRGSNGVRFLSAWALFSSRGCGRGVRGSTRPLPVLSGAGSLPSLGLQWRRSSAPVTPQPRPRLLLPAQQLRPPRPFSPRTPPPAAGQPARARTPPARRRSQQKPVPPSPQCACDSVGRWAGWGGVFSFPPGSPPPSPPQAPALSTLWCSSTHPIIYPQPPTFAALASPFPLSSSSVFWHPLCPPSPA